MATTLRKTTLFNEFARIGKALANPLRLELLDLLCQAPRTVEILANLIGQSLAATSHHLRTLLAARLVTSEKRGLYVTYHLADKDVSEFWLTLQQLAHHRLPDLRQATRELLEETEVYQPVDRMTLMARLRRGEVTLIDVRPEEEYEAGHIPGALSVPLERLEALLPSLPADREMVAYSRGPYCVLAPNAVEMLHRHNRRAVRLLDGILQWRAAGLPVEEGLPAP